MFSSDKIATMSQFNFVTTPKMDITVSLHRKEETPN